MRNPVEIKLPTIGHLIKKINEIAPETMLNLREYLPIFAKNRDLMLSYDFEKIGLERFPSLISELDGLYRPIMNKITEIKDVLNDPIKVIREFEKTLENERKDFKEYIESFRFAKQNALLLEKAKKEAELQKLAVQEKITVDQAEEQILQLDREFEKETKKINFVKQKITKTMIDWDNTGLRKDIKKDQLTNLISLGIIQINSSAVWQIIKPQLENGDYFGIEGLEIKMKGVDENVSTK